MALGIYKSGQGYWVRVMTAAGLGILTLAAAAWAWNQMVIVADALPTSHYSMSISGAQLAATPGQEVTLLGKADSPTAPEPLVGTGKVVGLDVTNSELTIDSVKLEPGITAAGQAKHVRIGDARLTITTGTFKGMPPVAKGLLQSVTACAILLIGTVLAYWVCAIRPKTGDFLISTDMEMKKVHWSTWKDIKSQTAVVIGAAVLIAGFLFVADLALKAFFQMIDIIKVS